MKTTLLKPSRLALALLAAARSAARAPPLRWAR